MKDISVEQAKLAVEKSPNDLRLQTNLKFVSGVIDSEPETSSEAA
jgi:hypothetical protein